MKVPTNLDFVRYLAAKKGVDDRALNARVWQRLAEILDAESRDPELRVLEVGAGIGAMVERIADLDLAHTVSYTAIDQRAETVEEARRRLSDLPESVRLELEAVDLYELVEREQDTQGWDLLVASALLDLVDVSSTLPRLLSIVRPGGICYFALNFDGATIFEPAIDSTLDALIECLYHRSMDERVVDGRRSGDSRCGRHLFSQLRTNDAEILAVGSSDWVVSAGADGYPDDEAYFLHCIIEFVQDALSDHPELDAEEFAEWLRLRRAQIDDGGLVYIAHQLDFLARRAP